MESEFGMVIDPPAADLFWDAPAVFFLSQGSRIFETTIILVFFERPGCTVGALFVSSYPAPAGGVTFARMTPNEVIGSWIRQLAREFLVNRARDIVKQGLINTEDLLRSLDAKTIVEPERGKFAIIFFARVYGRWQDMRRRYSRVGGKEMIEDLEAWAEKEGVDKFTGKGRRNYSGMYRNMPKERVLNRIAWGIVRKYRQKGTAPKKGWYNRGKERDINTFYDLLLRLWRDAVLEDQARKMSGN